MAIRKRRRPRMAAPKRPAETRLLPQPDASQAAQVNVAAKSPDWRIRAFNSLRYLLRILEVFAIFGTLFGVWYLIRDSIYQTEATISSQASNPDDPFYFPFTITNNSHLFSIYNVEWTCAIESMIYANQSEMSHVDIVRRKGIKNELLPGESLNISCSGILLGKALKGELNGHVEYDTDILWYRLHHSNKTRFNWMGESPNAQWIRGEFPGR